VTLPANQLLQLALQLPLADREQMADQLYLSLQVQLEVKAADRPSRQQGGFFGLDGSGPSTDSRAD